MRAEEHGIHGQTELFYIGYLLPRNGTEKAPDLSDTRAVFACGEGKRHMDSVNASTVPRHAEWKHTDSRNNRIQRKHTPSPEHKLWLRLLLL